MADVRFTYSGSERLVENISLIKPGVICGLEVMKAGRESGQVKRYTVAKMENVSFPGLAPGGQQRPQGPTDTSSVVGAPAGTAEGDRRVPSHSSSAPGLTATARSPRSRHSREVER